MEVVNLDSIDMFLRDPASGAVFQFPVNPARIQIRGEALLDTVEIARIGEADFHVGNRRTQLSWEAFLPSHYDPHYCRYVAIPDPIDARDRLVNWRIAGTVLRLIATGQHGQRRRDLINVPVIISTLNPEYRGGEPGDIWYEITLRQFREVQIRTVAEANVGDTLARLDVIPVPGRYVVQDGDTLWLIAKLQLGYGERWETLYNLNRETIGPDPNIVVPGTVLVMPSPGAPPSAVPPAVPTEEVPRDIRADPREGMVITPT